MNENECIEHKKNICSVLHTIHTLHDNSVKRTPVVVRMNRSFHKGAMKYCSITGLTAGQFYEQAGTLFMDLNPVPGVIVSMGQRVSMDFSKKDKIRSLICLQELEEYVPILRENREQGRKHHKKLLENIRKTFRDYDRIVNPTDKLEKLVEEALTYLDI